MVSLSSRLGEIEMEMFSPKINTVILPCYLLLLSLVIIDVIIRKKLLLKDEISN